MKRGSIAEGLYFVPKLPLMALVFALCMAGFIIGGFVGEIVTATISGDNRSGDNRSDDNRRTLDIVFGTLISGLMCGVSVWQLAKWEVHVRSIMRSGQWITAEVMNVGRERQLRRISTYKFRTIECESVDGRSIKINFDLLGSSAEKLKLGDRFLFIAEMGNADSVLFVSSANLSRLECVELANITPHYDK